MVKVNSKYGRFLMSCVNESSFIDIKNAVINAGDNIQSLAIDFILKQNGINEEDIIPLKRDGIPKYKNQPMNLIFHSEFTEENIDNRIVDNNKINVLGVVSSVLYDEFDTLCNKNQDVLSFFKKYEPIGCRDEKTVLELRKYGIEAYIMGCFTMCFPKRDMYKEYKKVFFVDAPKELDPYIPLNIRENIEYLTHSILVKTIPIDEVENQRIDGLASNLLNRYRNEAKLVVTSRLHVAIPCVAMGIPVILANNNIDFRFSWIEKYLRPYQLGEYEMIDWNPTVKNVEKVKSVLYSYFSDILSGGNGKEQLKWLDEYYASRVRITPYLGFRNQIKKISIDKNAKFNYAIWGKGNHCRYAYELVNEMYPHANLVCVVDKYKEGIFKNVKVIKESELDKYKIDIMLITTVPGKKEAIQWLEKHKTIKYLIITSQNRS